MPWRKANHPAGAGHCLGAQQIVSDFIGADFVRQNGREIIIKNERAFVRRVMKPAGPLVPGAQITLRIVAGSGWMESWLLFSLPRTLRAMWRDEDPIACQGVEASVGGIGIHRFISLAYGPRGGATDQNTANGMYARRDAVDSVPSTRCLDDADINPLSTGGLMHMRCNHVVTRFERGAGIVPHWQSHVLVSIPWSRSG